MNKRNKRITNYFILFSLILILGVVYSVLQANLQINGTTKITQNSWDVHFDSIQVTKGSVPIGTGDTGATIDPNNPLKVDFEVTLSTPGDFYEFTVDVENDGSIDAMIGTLTKTLKVNNVTVSEIPDYLNYSVTYENDTEILEKHLLAKGKKETLKIRLEFKTDIEVEDLPGAATTITTSVETQYIQADDTAIKIIKPSFVGYYADIEEDGIVDGIIYADLLAGKTTDGNSYTIPTISNAKEYHVSQEEYNGPFGTHAVLSPSSSTGAERFYIMALTDADGTSSGETIYCWYSAAGRYGGSGVPESLTSSDFGSGRDNTENVLEAWLNEEYGSQNEHEDNINDIWEEVQYKANDGWFVPSRQEWEAFIRELDITVEKANNYGLFYKDDLPGVYWSSSLSSTTSAVAADYINPEYPEYTYNEWVDFIDRRYLRLSNTF
ncbi:MAG: hypothetical protein IJG68_01515 [Bacilli bacterium]|nr:hypothetical protein [Bacilli bacterium]